jgi:formate dehydrogenase (coenzyme F420) beta subunit
MSESLEAMRAQARQLLAEGRVEFVVGYEAGSDGVNARPFFARTPEETDRIIFDATCTHNLTTYLADSARRGKGAGVVVKPCDARALNVLIHERQRGADSVVAISATCAGVVQRTREGGDGVTLQERCRQCGDRAQGANGEAGAAFGRVAEFERLSDAEREAFWAEQFGRCIRCYACRQVCPACYCEECFAETLDPEWVGIRMGAGENWMFHAMRAFHLAGRCVGCDECERVCPVSIPLGLLNGKLRKELLETFDYRAGISPDQAPPLATFKKDEKLGVG